jgi:uncharacterized protein (DUF1778 family)
MNKGGRPRKAAQARDRTMTIRLTADEKAQLYYLAKTEGGTITGFITRIIHDAAGVADIYQRGAHENKG